jgi:hypothetical protein
MEIKIYLDKFQKIKGNDFIKKYKKYKKIIITWNNISLDFIITKREDLYTSKKSYFLHTTQKSDDSSKDIINILFHDIIKKVPSFSNIYIKNISKKDGLISGSDAVLFAIAIIQKISEAKFIYLYDAATIKYKNSENELDLSLYKLIVDDRTFYGKFGFELYFKQSLQKKLLYYASKIKNYTIDKIIVELKNITSFIEKNYYNKMSGLVVNYYSKAIETKKEISYSEKKEIYNNYQIIIGILSKLNKNLKFNEGIIILNKKYFFELCMLFDKIINKNSFYNIISFTADPRRASPESGDAGRSLRKTPVNSKISVSSKFILLFIKLYILQNNIKIYMMEDYYQFIGLYRRKVFI